MIVKNIRSFIHLFIHLSRPSVGEFSLLTVCVFVTHSSEKQSASTFHQRPDGIEFHRVRSWRIQQGSHTCVTKSKQQNRPEKRNNPLARFTKSTTCLLLSHPQALFSWTSASVVRLHVAVTQTTSWCTSSGCVGTDLTSCENTRTGWTWGGRGRHLKWMSYRSCLTEEQR